MYSMVYSPGSETKMARPASVQEPRDIFLSSRTPQVLWIRANIFTTLILLLGPPYRVMIWRPPHAPQRKMRGLTNTSDHNRKSSARSRGKGRMLQLRLSSLVRCSTRPDALGLLGKHRRKQQRKCSRRKAAEREMSFGDPAIQLKSRSCAIWSNRGPRKRRRSLALFPETALAFPSHLGFPPSPVTCADIFSLPLDPSGPF